MEFTETILSIIPATNAWAVYVSEEGDPLTDQDCFGTEPIACWALIEKRHSAEDAFLNPEDNEGPRREVVGMIVTASGILPAKDGPTWDGLFVGYTTVAAPPVEDWVGLIRVVRRQWKESSGEGAAS